MSRQHYLYQISQALSQIKGDQTFDGAFYISPSEAKTIAKTLSSISEDEFKRREKLSWDLYDFEDGHEFFSEEFVSFYSLTAEENSGILIDISA